MKHIKINIKQTNPGNLPYVILYHGKNGYRFLIDTGSTSSWIDPQCLGQFIFENEVSFTKKTFNGEKQRVFPSTLRIKPTNGTSDDYESVKFRAELICKQLDTVTEMNKVISEPIHGILGMDFLMDNSITIDVNKSLLLV